jgi:ribonuclease BN (tRNA processing enzyme)
MHPMRSPWFLTLAVTAAPWLCGAQAAPASSAPPPRTRVVFLGTGTPNADPERSGPATAVVVGDRAYVFDAGPGVVRRAAAAARAGVAPLEAKRLGLVFLTHLHSDHTVGLPDLLYTPWVLERTAPLVVYGPRGTADMLSHISAAWRADVRNRIDGAEPANTTGWRATVRAVREGEIYRDSLVTVRAFRVPHGDWDDAWGYRVETPDGAVVISGDTRASDAVVRACDGCAVLVHEVYSAERFRTRPPEWQRYHARAHTSTVELAALATRARPAMLLLTHQLYWGATDDDLVAEIRAAGYAGAVRSGRDLDVIALPVR